MPADSFEIDLNNIPEDPVAALALLQAIESGDAPPQPAADAATTAAAEAAAASAAAAAASATTGNGAGGSEPGSKTQTPAASSETEPDGVATKDGKHVIPYSVLKSERERSNAAQAALQAATDRIAALEAQVNASANGANTGAAARAADAATAAAPDMSDADLEALREDFPTVYKALTATMQYAKALESQVKEQATFRQDVETATKTAQQETVQDAIDANPKLAQIQATDPAAFQLAQQLDDTLKMNPAWKDKPMSERFAKVIEMVELTNGAIALPGGKSQQQQQAPNAAELRAQAQAAAAAAAKANANHVPVSLSEFPVGEPPAQDERGALESMSPFQIAAKFASMSPEKMDAYLATL